MNTQSCDMRRADSMKVWEMAPGDFKFQKDEKDQLWFHCCLPGGTKCVIPIQPAVTPGLNGGNYWIWDGNEDAPTLTPSINSIGCWHGFVRAGRMESC